MSTVMPAPEREQFLAEPHVGVLSVVDPRNPTGTLAVPIWYDYRPDIGVWVLTGPTSAKAVAMESARRYAITAQAETIPYRYVTVEGPITDIRPTDPEADLLPMSIRYFDRDLGTRYYEQVRGDVTNVYVMQPEHWRSTDLTEAFEALSPATTGNAPRVK